jgi:hypothetical protein
MALVMKISETLKTTSFIVLNLEIAKGIAQFWS